MNWLDYYLGPTGIPDRLRAANEIFNPIVGIEDAMLASERMMDPELQPWDRVGAFGDMATNVAGVVAPVAAVRAGGQSIDDAIRAAEEVLTGVSMSPGTVAAKDFAADQSGAIGRTDDITARGDQVLSMLKGGRGAEVTDDMLDLGDPVQNARLNEYLFNNYDLPMDEASRMGRAGEMGFDTNSPLFHGGLTPHDSVRPATDVRDAYEGVGTYNADSYHGPGYYTTTSPRDASLNYASPDGPDVRNKIERAYEEIQEMDFDQLADEIRLTLKPEDIEALDPQAARLLREVNAMDQSNLTTGDTEAWEDYISGSSILNDLADLTARRKVGASDGFVNPLYGRPGNVVRTKGRDATNLEYNMREMDPADYLDDAGGDMDVARELAIEDAYNFDPQGSLIDATEAAIRPLYDNDLYDQADELRGSIFERAMDYGGMSAEEWEMLIRNSPAAEYGIDYNVTPGGMISEGYRGAGFNTIDLPAPRTTFSNMPNLEDTAFHRVFTDPTAVRSRFARFDPRLAHLRNLSAGAAGVGMVSGTGQNDPERKNQLQNYLDGLGL